MKIKDLQIRKMEETVQGLELKMKDKDLKNKNLQDKVLLSVNLSNNLENIQFFVHRAASQQLICYLFSKFFLSMLNFGPH